MSASPATRRPIVAGNWKMNLLRADAEQLCAGLRDRLGSAAVDVLLFPSAPLLDTVVAATEGSTIACGGQDVHPRASGAHTGDVSAAQLRDAGCTWALTGHSERRRDHGEGDDLVGAKARAANDHGLVALICVGETAEERRDGRTFEVLERQLAAALAPGLDRFELAYEPVWAIGTGDTASPEQAAEAHAFLRQRLRQEVSEAAAEATRILYGGSANPSNVEELFARSEIDGFLVGGASLDSEKFSAMIHACAG